MKITFNTRLKPFHILHQHQLNNHKILLDRKAHTHPSTSHQDQSTVRLQLTNPNPTDTQLIISHLNLSQNPLQKSKIKDSFQKIDPLHASIIKQPSPPHSSKTSIQSASNSLNSPVSTSIPNTSSTTTRTPVSPPQTNTKTNRRPKKQVLNLTPKAINHLSSLLHGPSPKLIRIGVKNKGCAGMAYHLEYVEKPGNFDEVVTAQNEQGAEVKILVDSRALFSIIGSTMDWQEDKLGNKFVFENPNVKEACGCGESFLV